MSRGQAPYGTKPACAKRAARTPPPVVPHPKFLAAQAAYTEALLPGSAWIRIVPRLWGPPRASHRFPYCEYGNPSSPAGTAAAECPWEEEPPDRVGSSADFPKSPITAGLCVTVSSVYFEGNRAKPVIICLLFITAVPIIMLFARGERDSGGHVL
jgi:hypothetical protein